MKLIDLEQILEIQINGSIKRYDGPAGVEDRHYNKILKEYVDTPHVHDPSTSGGIRHPEHWEIPN